MWASWQHAGYVDARSAAVAHTMLDATGLRHGERVLNRLWPRRSRPRRRGDRRAGRRVVLSDFAPEMTAIAAERARGLGLTNVTTRELDLERIDYPDAFFDLVLCRDGPMLVPTRPLRAGGPPGPDRTGERSSPYGDRANAVGDPVRCRHCCARRGGAPGIPGPFSLDAPGALEELWYRQGSPTSPSEVSAPGTPPPSTSGRNPLSGGPLAQLLASIPAAVAATIRAGAETALAVATSDGYELPGVGVVGVGRR